MLTYVWAQSQDGVIGKNGTVPWHMPADMHHFQQVTINHPIVCGRRTYKSFGRPLPHRLNMVITRHDAKNFPDNVKVFHSVKDFLKVAKQHADQEIMVCGGAQIYKALLPNVNKLCLTKIDMQVPDGDTKMPEINYDNFKLVSSKQFKADAKNPHDYQFLTYIRK